VRDIVLVTVDSLRADHVGWQGYGRETTPALDGIAADATTFPAAFAHACSTRPSFPAILTSSYPLMYGGYGTVSGERTPVAEVLEEAGYATAGFHSNLYLGADFGYDRGFETFYDSKDAPSVTARIRQAVKTHLDENGVVYSLLQTAFNATEKRAGIEVGSAYVGAEELTDMAIEWATDAPDGPRFLWIHYMDVHHPYVPPAEYQRRFRETPVEERAAIRLRRKMLESPAEVTEAELDTLIDLYDAEIAYVDAEVARLVDAIEAAWGEDVAFVFTADHGEEFLDHGGFSHSATFYDEVLHVPLLVDTGGTTGESDGTGTTPTRDDLVGLLDIAPTLADLADAEQPETFQGQSLLGDDGPERDSVIAEWADLDTGDRRFALRTADWKYIRDEHGEEQLFDLDADPGETENLADSQRDVLGDLRDRIDRHETRVDETAGDMRAVEMDEQVRQRLRDLGYQE
jgi:arylsulfatase A-like enzyme